MAAGVLLSGLTAEAASSAASRAIGGPDWHRAGVLAAMLLFLAARRARRV